MKKLLYLLSFLFVAAVIFSCDKEAESSNIQGEVQVENRDASVWICHKPDGNNPHAVYVDQNAVDAHLGHGDALLDADGDGYTAANACGEGSMDDCNDGDASINPGATEVPYDGIDNDCDPTTLDDDLDQDGYVLADDCNDNDASVNPGATEVCDDGIDNNCNEETDEGCSTLTGCWADAEAEALTYGDVDGYGNYSGSCYYGYYPIWEFIYFDCATYGAWFRVIWYGSSGQCDFTLGGSNTSYPISTYAEADLLRNELVSYAEANGVPTSNCQTTCVSADSTSGNTDQSNNGLSAAPPEAQ